MNVAPAPLPAHSPDDQIRKATLAVAQRVLDGKLPRGELLETLDQLGLVTDPRGKMSVRRKVPGLQH